jgi:L-fuconolactonase
MVFDHLNQPPIATNQRFGEWGDLMKAAAGNKNFHAKISGLGTVVKKEHNWTAADIQPYVEFALEHFSTDRCFCGGDWPVSLLAGSYAKTWNNYTQLLGSVLNSAEQEKVFSKNAAAFYKL